MSNRSVLTRNASAAIVHFGLDPGKFVRWMGGEYTGYHRDVKKTLIAVRPHVTDEDYDHILRHTIQTVVMKPGKNDRLVWDGTTTLLALDIVMNQVTPVNREAPITFGHVKIQLYIDIYNTRISHPYVIILLGMADIKACFRFPRIHPDLTGAFGFMAGGFYNLATAMVFWIYYLHV